MTRARPEWIAKHDDQAIPKAVRARIWLREEGRCYLTGKKLRPGDEYDFEHVIPLSCGGQHRETNIRIASKAAHKAKTATDVGTAAKIKRVALKHAGLWPKPLRPLHSRGFGPSRRGV